MGNQSKSNQMKDMEIDLFFGEFCCDAINLWPLKEDSSAIFVCMCACVCLSTKMYSVCVCISFLKLQQSKIVYNFNTYSTVRREMIVSLSIYYGATIEI